MNIQTNIALSTLTTMKLGGNANYVADVTSRDEVQKVYLNTKKLGQPVYVIGGGSNLIARDEGFPGVIIHNRIMGIDIVSDDKSAPVIRVGAGESWDGLVAMTVQKGWSGIESLSGIPGTVGASPVQNIGAYGQELADTFQSLEAYDTVNDTFVELNWEDCGFSYRHSIFRGNSMGRYIITSVTLKLTYQQPEAPFYDSLQKYFDELGTTTYTVQAVRDGVMTIRRNKLPDPTQLPNSGSFFKNAIVESWKVDDLHKNYPDMPAYPVDDKHLKVPAGWLIENVDLKGQILNGIKIHDGNAVVLINESATSYANLATAREEIVGQVRDKFQIILEQEPLELTYATSISKL